MPKSPGIVDEDGVSSETAIEKLNSEKRFSLCSQNLTFVGKESWRMLLRVAGLFLLQRFCKQRIIREVEPQENHFSVAEEHGRSPAWGLEQSDLGKIDLNNVPDKNV